MTNRKRIVFFVIGLCIGAIAACVLAGCNTMAGLGRDIERASEGLRNAMIQE
jgi:predicted small secreted protein